MCYIENYVDDAHSYSCLKQYLIFLKTGVSLHNSLVMPLKHTIKSKNEFIPKKKVKV